MLSTAVLAAALLVPGQPLPPLKGTFLTGREAVLPDVARGQIALLALGFTYDSRFAVEAWVRRFRQDFEHQPRVTFFEIPMIGGMARLGKWFIDSGMRKGTPKPDQGHVITVYGSTDVWKQRAGFEAPDAAYLILIDETGHVQWTKSVAALDAKVYEDLSNLVSSLLKGSL